MYKLYKKGLILECETHTQRIYYNSLYEILNNEDKKTKKQELKRLIEDLKKEVKR